MNVTRNPLEASTRRTAVKLLNSAVADLFDLYARTKQAHWNLRGPAFIALHEMLDEFAEEILKHLDAAAERATALGGTVEGTLRQTVSNSRLKRQEQPASRSSQRDWLRELADVHATCSSQLRSAIKKTSSADDFGTADLCTDALRAIDKQLWMLEAHLSPQ